MLAKEQHDVTGDDRPYGSLGEVEEGRALLTRANNCMRIPNVDNEVARLSSGTAIWEQEAKAERYAVLGQILHASPDEAALLPSDAIELKDSKNRRRIFNSNINGALLLLKLLKAAEATPKQAIHIRMIPSPWTSLGVYGTTAFPRLDLRVEFDPQTNAPFLQSLKATVDERHVDIMLPEEPSDVRLVSRMTFQHAGIETDARLTDFLANASLRIKNKDGTRVARRGRLNTPPTLTMRIPARMIPADVRAKAAPDALAEETEMEYLFAGLDFRETLQYNLAKYRKLEYTVIGGGASGGRRAELVLRKAPPEGADASLGLREDEIRSTDGTTGTDEVLDPEVVELLETAYAVAGTLDHRGSRRSTAQILRTRWNV